MNIYIYLRWLTCFAPEHMHEYSDGNVLPICLWYAEKQATGWWHPNATGWTNNQAWSQNESQTGKVNPEEKKNKVC